MNNRNYKWALVLSGGGARGMAHIGFLKGLADAGFPAPDLVAGTSMGAIVGGLYACGMAPEEMSRFVREEFKIGDYLESFVFKLDGPVGQIMQTGQVLASLATSTGVDNGHKVLELFEKLTRRKTFDETDIPFRCNAVDLKSGSEIIFRSGSVAKAMRASMSFPLFFEPLEEDGMCLVDGGIIDNMPVKIAIEEGFRHILAVNVNRNCSVENKELKSGPQIIYRSIECSLCAREKQKEKTASLTIDITNDETPFSFDQQREFLKIGEEAAVKNLEALKRFFSFKLESKMEGK